MSLITTQQRDHIFDITLNRPEKRNAVVIQMLQAVEQAVAEAEHLPGVRVIVLRGEGKNFSTGLDVTGMGGMQDLMGDDWQQHGHEVTRIWQSCIRRLGNSSLPSIALLHSYTLGVGLELALACDFRIAADYTVLSLEEARLGLIPDVGGTTNLMRLVGPARARELILTGRRIDAPTAEQWGLVNQVVPADDLIEAGDKLAGEIVACAPLAISAAKRVMHALEDVESGLHLEMVEQNPLFASEDFLEGIQAAIERRSPNWKGR
jgi:enoyl-CoA hydratase/carnithine racemase